MFVCFGHAQDESEKRHRQQQSHVSGQHVLLLQHYYDKLLFGVVFVVGVVGVCVVIAALVGW